MKLYVSGVPVPKLGSIHDRITGQYLTKEAQKESKKILLSALLTANTIVGQDADAISKYEKKIQRIYNQYLELEFGIEIPEQTEKETQMLEYYTKVVKSMKPMLSRGKDGSLHVSGLEKLVAN
jgi:adenine-specific DNA methylase